MSRYISPKIELLKMCDLEIICSSGDDESKGNDETIPFEEEDVKIEQIP